MTAVIIVSAVLGGSALVVAMAVRVVDRTLATRDDASVPEDPNAETESPPPTDG